MPRSNGYATLISTAQSFLDKVGPLKSTFCRSRFARGLRRTARRCARCSDTANTTRARGKAQQVGGTAGLEAKAKEGMLVLHELDAIYSYQFRNDPVLLAAWKSTCHVEQDPERESDGEQPPVGSGSGSGSGSQPEPTVLAMNGAAHGTHGSHGQESEAFAGVEPRVTEPTVECSSANANDRRSGACARPRGCGDD